VTRACALFSFVAVAALAAAVPAQQVGYPPTASPYQDFSNKQEFTLYTGWFTGNTGRAGVGPQGSPLLGVRYGIKLGGPVEADVHVSRAFTQREVVSPDDIPAERDRGNISVPLYLADVGLTFNMTGNKSWHHIIPTFSFGGGAVSDAGATKDIAQYRVGTQFAITFGGGLRYVPGGHWSLRAEISDFMFQTQYPNSFFVAPSGLPPVLPANSAQNQWLHNGLLTLGVSYLVGH
jgi:hypothetical protein